MKLEVEVICNEIVKPSSPTPDSLRSYKLSFLDQLTTSLYNPFIFFYPEICDTEASRIKTSDHLKQSISNALTYFYPLAGRIMEKQLFVDCKDEGIPFLEARVMCRLSDVVDDNLVSVPPCEMNKLLPFKIHGADELPLGVQFNVFDCGGVAIGVCISHTIGDAVSFYTFVNMWAAIARGEEEKSVTKPEFVSASLFPQRDLSGFRPSIPTSKETIVTKRFVFTASKIEEIRARYADETTQTRPSRVEALSAFIWTRFITTTEAKSRPDTLFSLYHLINLRSRIDPPQPQCSFGNLYSFTVTFLSIDSSGEICPRNLVSQIKDSIKRVDKEYVKKIQDGYNHLDDVRERAASYGKREMLSFTFTSLCRLPMYEADFGWGKPVWACSAD